MAAPRRLREVLHTLNAGLGAEPGREAVGREVPDGVTLTLSCPTMPFTGTTVVAH
jgi:hypothetical protein